MGTTRAQVALPPSDPIKFLSDILGAISGTKGVGVQAYCFPSEKTRPELGDVFQIHIVVNYMDRASMWALETRGFNQVTRMGGDNLYTYTFASSAGDEGTPCPPPELVTETLISFGFTKLVGSFYKNPTVSGGASAVAADFSAVMPFAFAFGILLLVIVLVLFFRKKPRAEAT